MDSKEIRKRVCLATKKFYDGDYLGEQNGFMVFDEGDTIAFVNIRWSLQELDFKELDVDGLRNEFEKATIEFFIAHPELNETRLRCDEVSFNIVSSNRAIVRQITNAIR